MELAVANLLQLALIVTGVIGLLLTLDRPRLRAASAIMGMSALWMVFNLLEERLGWREVWLTTPAFRLLYPPLLYFLVRGLVYSGPALRLRDLLQGLPFVIALALNPIWLAGVEHAARISLVVYSALAIRLVWQFHTAIVEQRSDAARVRLNVVYVILGIFLADTLYDVIRMDAVWAHEIWPWLTTSAAYELQLVISLVTLAALVVLTVRREALFEGLAPGALSSDALPPDALFPDTLAPESAPRHERDDDQRLADFDHIDRVIRQEAFYSEPRLTRAEVAKASGLNERRVSEAIRAGVDRNFNDYINRLRIDDVMTQMQSVPRGEAPRLLDMAFTAGFSSKSVFNAVFKKETGETPSACLKRLQAKG